MGYERDDRRYGGTQNERDRFSYSRDDKARTYGDRDYGRSTSDYGSRDRPADRGGYGRDYARGDDQDRGFFERAGDEVRSWFGDEDAERRRRQDDRYEDRGRSDYGSRDHARGSAASGYGSGDYSRGSYDQQRRTSQDHEPSYRSWRDRQMESFDRDYEDYRREHQSKFDQEFHGWRQTRQGQRDLVKKVQEHQEVVGSDGEHIGKVDHVRGDHIKLAKNDQAAGGHHHAIPFSWLQSVDDKVTLNKTAAQAKQQWREDDESSQRDQRGALFGQRDDERRDGGDANPNRSFSGTY